MNVFRTFVMASQKSMGWFFCITCVFAILPPVAQSATRIKQNNTDDLNLASSWDTLPGLLDIAQWDSTVTGANSTVLGEDLTWAGIKLVAPGGAVAIGGGNTLTIGSSGIDLSTSTQNLTINSGLKIVGQQSWKAAASKTLDVAGAFTRTGAYVDFSTFNASAVLGTLGNTYNILGPWAYSGATTTLKYVTTSGGAISAYTGATADAGNLASVTSATDNYKYSAAATLGGNRTGNTLQYTGAANTTALGTYSLTLNGLMNAGSGKLTITGAAGSPGLVAGANGELDIVSNNQNIDILSVISGTGALVYGGPSAATLTLSGTNTYSGGTIINAGTLSAGITTNAVFGTGNVTVHSGGTLKINQNAVFNFPMTLTLNGGMLIIGYNGNRPNWSGPVTLSANSTIDATGLGAALSYRSLISGNISGPGGLTKTSTGSPDGLYLTGANNTYSGPTVVSKGLLLVKSSIYGNDPLKWTSANITVTTNSTLALNVGGSGEFTPTQAGTLFCNLTNVNNNGLLAGSAIGFDTSNAGATVTYSNIVADSTGPGGGMVGLKKIGANTLELTGANTYSGQTILDAGTLKVSSFNSINGGTPPLAGSSLGRPTTIANGTIEIGKSAFGGGTLIYTGTGETTDRIINIQGQNATTVLDQSGAGLLKFTSPIQMQTGQAKTFTLQGSTAGIGELSATLTDPSVTVKTTLNKAGTGTWILSGANTYSGNTKISAGALQALHGMGLPSSSYLQLDGGVLQGTGTFTRVNSTTVAGANFQWLSVNGGGFSANGGKMTVTIGGSAATEQVWGTAVGNDKILGSLKFCSTNANAETEFQNNIDLLGANRTIDVAAGTGGDFATLSGVIRTSTGTAGLIKTGAGTLKLSNVNTYNGTTAVNVGTLLVNGINSGSGTITAASGATLGGKGRIGGAATFSSGAKAVFTVTRDPVSETNMTPMTVTGVITFNSTEVHLNLPANLPSGVYTLATSATTPSGSVATTPVVDSGSYAAGFSSAVVSLDTVNKKLLLTVNGLPTYPTKLAVTDVNGGVTPTAGVPFNVTLQAQDANGVARRAQADTAVTLSVKTGAGSLGGTVAGTILAGTSALTISGVTYSKDESGVVLTATRDSGDTLTAGDSAPFTVIPDTTPVALDIVGFPSPQTAGVAGTVTVTAKTGSGATATSYEGTVHFSSSSVLAGLPSDYTFVPGDSGVHIFTGLTLNTAGTQSITVTDTLNSSLTDTQSGIIVTPATAATLIVSGFPTPQGTGVPGSVTVTAKDAYGNADTNYTGTIHFTSSDLSAGLPGDYTFTGGDLGTYTFVNGVMLTALGLQSITATDTVTGSITGTQSNITIWILPTIFSWTNTVSGSWSSSGNWTNDMGVFYAPVAAGQPDYTLTFNAGTYTATHNLNNGFVLNQLHFAGAVTIVGSSGMMLTNNGAVQPLINQNSGNSVLITTPLNLTTQVTLGGTGNGSMELFGTISGNGGLIITNSGTLLLSSTSENSYRGGTTVNRGALSLGAQGNSLFGTGPLTVNPGATLNLNGNGNITNSILLAGATVNNGNSYSANLNGPVTLEGTNTFDLATTGNMTIGGKISGTGGLTKLGSGQGPLNLNATNTFTGTTTINAGTILINTKGQLASQMIVVNAGSLKLSNSSSLAETVSVTIADGGAKIDIPNGVTQTVNMLYLGSDGKPEWIGTWGHSSSDATNKDDVHFTATSGKLRVLAGLQRGMVITLH